MHIHIFKAGDPECWRWTDVQPGDMVRSEGTHAWKATTFANRDCDTKYYVLGGAFSKALLLVMARYRGIPGEPNTDEFETFVVMSRHGPLVILQRQRENKDDADKT